MASYLPLLLSLLAQTTNPSPPIPPPVAAPVPAPPPVLREISPGVLEFNGIRLEKKKRRITFPASVNQRQGLIEYLLVNDKGKTHESLFSTTVPPHNIHLAMLLIGLQENEKANPKETIPPQAIDSAYLQSAPKLEGTPVAISVAWTENGNRKEIPVEDWIFNRQTSHPMTRGSWAYNGSLVQDGVFLADQELSIVAVITDPTALVNNPRQGYNDDEIWQVRDGVVPPLDTPVEISITLAEPRQAAHP